MVNDRSLISSVQSTRLTLTRGFAARWELGTFRPICPGALSLLCIPRTCRVPLSFSLDSLYFGVCLPLLTTVRPKCSRFDIHRRQSAHS